MALSEQEGQRKGGIAKTQGSLVSAPGLGLSDTAKLFHLFVDERLEVTKGMLTQTLGPWKRPICLNA